jgi:hypothetical protein
MLALRRRLGGERAAVARSRFPLATLELRAVALDRLSHCPVGVAVEALAVDAHAGGDDQPAHRILQERLEQDPGANGVDRAVVGDLVHALADADARGEVDDGVDPVDRLGDGGRIADVAFDQLDLVVEVGGPLALRMDLRVEPIECTHLVAFLQQTPG